jgi:hypothetical protein
LGENVNSANKESSPFSCNDEKVLFFTSNGFSEYGDYVFFYTIRLGKTYKKRSDPINLDTKIITNSAEVSMFYDAELEKFC